MSATTTVTVMEPHNVNATLNYYNPEDGGKLYIGSVGEKRRKHTPRDVTIRDMRGHENDFALDKQGFQLIKKPSNENTFESEARIEDSYYKECAEIIKNVTGATRVTAINHVVRRQTFEELLEAEKGLDQNARSKAPGIATWIHVDQSYNGAYDRFHSELGVPRESLDKIRWGIINLWRPIRPITRNPLAMCDARSIEETQLKELEAIFPSQEFSEEDKENIPDYYRQSNTSRSAKPSFGLWALHPPTPADQNKWYYTSDMQPDEALLLKIFDSKKTGVARRSPHTSFSSSMDHGPARQSLEVRCLVFWDDQTSD